MRDGASARQVASMAKSLVVVESPAKAKTINKYLGRNYKVVASMGHVRDLPKSKLGVDVEDGFEPSYEVIASRKKVVTELKERPRRRRKSSSRPTPTARARPSAGTSPKSSAPATQEDPPPDVQRDHQEGVLEALEQPRRSTSRWSTRSRRVACSIGSSATRSARSSGTRSAAA